MSFFGKLLRKIYGKFMHFFKWNSPKGNDRNPLISKVRKLKVLFKISKLSKMLM